MSGTFDQQLIVLLLKKEFYERTKDFVSAELFPGVIKTLYKTIEKFHEEFPGDISLAELKEGCDNYNRLSHSQRDFLHSVIDGLETIEPGNPEISADILRKVALRHIAHEVGKASAYIMNGMSDDLSDIITVLERYDLEKLSRRNVDSLLVKVDSDLDSLLEAANPENLFKFRSETLSAHLSGVGRGNLVVVCARPEIGKSSFVSDCVAGFLEQGLRVDYYGNEEPGQKMLLNIIRAKYRCSDEVLREMVKSKKFNKGEWDELRKLLNLVDCANTSIDEVHHEIAKSSPDVVVLDQIDKFLPKKRTDNRVEELKFMYSDTRQAAKALNFACFALCQAGADAEGKRVVNYEMADMSKTGKAGEADLFLGIGKDGGPQQEDNKRWITVSKNKIDGIKGVFEVDFIPEFNTWG